MRVVTVVAMLGLASALAYPLAVRQTAINREAAALAWMYAIDEAQGRFRTANGGYAATLESLVEPCAGQAALLTATLAPRPDAEAGTPDDRRLVDSGHEIVMRPARGAADGPPDCHGRPTTTDFYVSARPLVAGRDGTRALAMTSTGRVFLFVDGVPPTEADMSAGGLATPLDALPR